MTQEERWFEKYQEVLTFIKTHKRNPSKHNDVERGRYLNWLKQQRKLMNAGKLKEDRVERFKALLESVERYKHVNQYV